MKKLLMIIGVLFSTSVSAATFTVTTSSDSGAGSLRDAISQAESNGTDDTITIDSSVVSTITLSSGSLAITKSVTIAPSSGTVTITRGSGTFSVFTVTNAVTATSVTLQNLIISNGLTALSTGASNRGGGLRVNGLITLSLSQVTFIDNAADQGGGLYLNLSGGAANLTDVSFIANSSSTGGAGLFVEAGSVTLTRTQFKRNVSSDFGGGLVLYSASGSITARVISSLFLQNDAQSQGGAIYANITNPGDSVIITRSTFSANDGDSDATATGEAGGIYVDNNGGGAFTLRNSILSGNGLQRQATPTNFTTSDNCALATGGSITLQGNNIVYPADTQCGSTPSSTADPLIQLQNTSNVLSVVTPYLGSLSAAINGGDATYCVSGDLSNVDLLSQSVTNTCEIGAYEFQESGGERRVRARQVHPHQAHPHQARALPDRRRLVPQARRVPGLQGVVVGGQEPLGLALREVRRLVLQDLLQVEVTPRVLHQRQGLRQPGLQLPELPQAQQLVGPAGDARYWHADEAGNEDLVSTSQVSLTT